MSCAITALYRYPVKGLRAESLAAVELQRGCAFPGDRQLAIVHRNSRYDPRHPAWITRRNFAVLAYSPELARLQVRFDARHRVLELRCDEMQWQIDVDGDDVDEKLDAALQYLNIESQPGPYTLAEVQGTALTDSPYPLISLMNTRSLADLQERSGFVVAAERFRGNVWFNGDRPWQERQWPGQTLQLGPVKIRVVEEIVRCRAIDAHPQSGQRDMPLLNRLGGLYGHTHFGVLAEVLQPGRLRRGDTIQESDSQPFGDPGF
jgi:uncharacterized protein YcbX